MTPVPGWPRLRIESSDSDTWLELAPLAPPRAMPYEGEFYGLLTLHRPDDELTSIVGWLPYHQNQLVEFLEQLAAAERDWDGGKLFRSEDDDLILECFSAGGEFVMKTRVLDWWDPYSPHAGPHERRRELRGVLRVPDARVMALPEEARRVLAAAGRK